MWSNEEYAEQPNQAPVGVGAPAFAPAQLGVPFAPQPHPGQPGTAIAPVQPRPPVATLPPSTGTALDGACDVPPTLVERIELCKFLAAANLLPQALRNEPANVLLIMHKAMALNLPLSVAIEHLHVIDGKVGHSAELLRALLYRHGHVLRWPNKSDQEVVGELTLRHDPKNPRREKFSITDAARMQLADKANWKKDPESMLIARCTTRLVSRHCPEIAVALGNLSAIDAVEDDAANDSTDEPTQSADEQAAALYAEAREATDTAQLKDIGARARERGLFEHKVDGNLTLQGALLKRINEIGNAKTADADRKPDPRAGKPGRGEASR